MTAFHIELQIALEEGQRLTRAWWRGRAEESIRRAGGMPPEVADLLSLTPELVTDPDSGERFAQVAVPLSPEISWGRARELAHMLTSVLTAEGHTLRGDGLRLDEIPGELPEQHTGEFGPLIYAEARACSHTCLACVFSSESRWGCCGEGCAFSLADIGSLLLQGGDEFAARVLALPGQLDGVKWHPYLKGGICLFHDPSKGCTLQPNQMPLQCRTYLCAPEKLLPPDLLADYDGYVETLEEMEYFVEEHMRGESGVDFDSPFEKVKEAAAKAFAAWESGAK